MSLTTNSSSSSPWSGITNQSPLAGDQASPRRAGRRPALARSRHQCARHWPHDGALDVRPLRRHRRGPRGRDPTPCSATSAASRSRPTSVDGRAHAPRDPPLPGEVHGRRVARRRSRSTPAAWSATAVRRRRRRREARHRQALAALPSPRRGLRVRLPDDGAGRPGDRPRRGVVGRATRPRRGPERRHGRPGAGAARDHHAPTSDAGQVSLVGTASLDWCREHLGVDADRRRIRPNLVVDDQRAVRRGDLGRRARASASARLRAGRADRALPDDRHRPGGPAARGRGGSRR